MVRTNQCQGEVAAQIASKPTDVSAENSSTATAMTMRRL
jgi:hypothetical protein